MIEGYHEIPQPSPTITGVNKKIVGKKLPIFFGEYTSPYVTSVEVNVKEIVEKYLGDFDRLLERRKNNPEYTWSDWDERRLRNYDTPHKKLEYIFTHLLSREEESVLFEEAGVPEIRYRSGVLAFLRAWTFCKQEWVYIYKISPVKNLDPFYICVSAADGKAVSALHVQGYFSPSGRWWRKNLTTIGIVVAKAFEIPIGAVREGYWAQ